MGSENRLSPVSGLIPNVSECLCDCHLQASNEETYALFAKDADRAHVKVSLLKTIITHFSFKGLTKQVCCGIALTYETLKPTWVRFLADTVQQYLACPRL